MITLPDYRVLERVEEYMRAVPYDVTRRQLYSVRSLYKGFDPKDSSSFERCYDTSVYRHYIKNGKKAETELERLARSLHDFGIEQALDRFLTGFDKFKMVGVMGGHGLLRTDPMYREIVLISRELTMRGSLMISGGGPGAMEATHLGAWLAGRSLEEVEEALYIVSMAPSFNDEGWLETAFDVMERFPQKEYKSLGIPTWLYGHEPSTPFATHIAKLFDNSIREATILNIAYGGIIFTPGSAGTLQEIFQDAVENHYLSYGVSSPMIFLGRKFWDEEVPIYPFLEDMMEKGRYKHLRLTLTDSAEEAIGALLDFRCGALHLNEK